MAKRQDKSSKDSGVRTKKANTANAKTTKTKTANAMSASEVIMTMTAKDAKRFLGSGLIKSPHNQNLTMVARTITPRKIFGHLW